MYLGIKIVFVGLTRQELILHKHVKREKISFYYNLQLLHFTYLCKVRFCQVIAKNHPFNVCLTRQELIVQKNV